MSAFKTFLKAQLVGAEFSAILISIAIWAFAQDPNYGWVFYLLPLWVFFMAFVHLWVYGSSPLENATKITAQYKAEYPESLPPPVATKAEKFNFKTQKWE